MENNIFHRTFLQILLVHIFIKKQKSVMLKKYMFFLRYNHIINTKEYYNSNLIFIKDIVLYYTIKY
jgi:hypothetical protein